MNDLDSVMTPAVWLHPYLPPLLAVRSVVGRGQRQKKRKMLLELEELTQ